MHIDNVIYNDRFRSAPVREPPKVDNPEIKLEMQIVSGGWARIEGCMSLTLAQKLCEYMASLT